MGVGEGEMGEEGGFDHVTLANRTTPDITTNANNTMAHGPTVPELRGPPSDPKLITKAIIKIRIKMAKTTLHPKILHHKMEMVLPMIPTTHLSPQVSNIDVTNELREIIALFLEIQPRMALPPPNANALILQSLRRNT